MGDRAFRYGDGVFATLALRHGRLLDARAHVARLNSSVGAMGLSTPDAVSSVDRLCEVLELVGVDGTADGVVRVQVSAVAGGRGYRRGAQTAWELVELHPLPDPRTLTVTVLGAEEAPIPSLPAVKTCSALAHVLCAAAAERRGVDEAVRTAGGRLLEASASNLFWEADGELFTPSDSLPLYPGVTRSVVIQEARRAGWTVHEGEFGPRALESASGAFLTNAVRGLEPIAELDGTPLDWPATLETLRVTVEEARTEAGLPVAGWAGPTDGSG
jgi:branched-subunit amino acid aminotransferase/4-amino-4-deoxychorismate lyase